MASDLTPTARALRALELLQSQPGVTAAALAVHLGVTERAARRYVAVLREAGVPATSTRGPYGGYRLGRGVRLPPVVFTAAEALGLVMAVLDSSHTAAGGDETVGPALDKLIRALPETVGRQAATVRHHAATAPDGGRPRPAAGTTSALVTAVAGHRRVGIVYRSASGSQWEEDVDPWAVVVRHGHWYLLCHSHRVAGLRAYRVDRVVTVAGRDETFRPPAGLDPVALLEQHLGTGWEYEARVVFDAPRTEVARYVRAPMGRLEPLDDGARCVLVGTTGNPQMYAGEWLAAIPLPFRVAGGPELRRAVGALAARLGDAVGAGPRPRPAP